MIDQHDFVAKHQKFLTGKKNTLRLFVSLFSSFLIFWTRDVGGEGG